jgi:hypothetical protein
LSTQTRAPVVVRPVPRADVAAAFDELRQRLNIDAPPPPNFLSLVRQAWHLAVTLSDRCTGGGGFLEVASARRAFVALALSWVESMAVSQSPLQLAQRLPLSALRPRD